MVTFTLPQIPGVPDELISAVAVEAERDAERIDRFLRIRGVLASPEHPVGLPANFLLELGAALRLLDCEHQGLNVHIEAGLPTAKQALDNAFGLLLDRPSDGPQLARRVLALFVERFAWHARRDWDAAVALDPLDDDAALDALAQFLWDHRHHGANRQP